jgi:Protein of unknown function (DUF3370)
MIWFGLSLLFGAPIVPSLPEPAPETMSPTRLAQSAQTISQPTEVRPLPGTPDQVPVFHSNSPELVQANGILLSTYPPAGKVSPEAHLNYAFNGRFDVFSHHVARGQSETDTRTLYMGILVTNPGRDTVRLSFREAASYISQESPWTDRGATESNLYSTSFSGPGSRLMNDILRDRRQTQWPNQVEIPPGETYLLMNAPIPLRRLTVATDGTLPAGSALLPPPLRNTARGNGSSSRINARSTYMRLSSSGPVYVANLAMYAPTTSDGGERVPSLDEWKTLLFRGRLVEPRDRPPTPPERANSVETFRYGRVAGVTQGSQWNATLADPRHAERLSLPAPGSKIAYVLSTVDRNTFGSGQIQSARMLARYNDTAYRSHGNYGLEYNLDLPLYNSSNQPKTITLSMQTPIQNERASNVLQFLNPPEDRVFFRGTVLVLYNADDGRPRANYVHVTQNRGDQGEPLAELTLAPGERRSVKVQFLYPPDATPPQVLTLTTVR